MRLISQAEARRRAARHVLPQMFGAAPVKGGDKANWWVYGVRREDVWVVYPEVVREASYGSSWIVVVCRRTGKVLYNGLANDEG